jgi:hypothetical protein
MRKHRTVQILGIVIIAAALVYLVLGVIGAISLGGSGLGEGWSSGWRGWLTIPILLTTFLGFVALLVFGALLYFLAKIDTNLAEAQQRLAVAAAKPAAVVAPVAVAAGVVAAERTESVVEVTAPEVAAPVAEAATVEVAAPAVAAVAAAGIVAAERHDEAVEAGGAAPVAEVPVVESSAVEGSAPLIAAAAVTGIVAAEQHEDEIKVAAPAIEAPAFEARSVEVAAPVIETPVIVSTVGAEVAASLPEVASEEQVPLPAAAAVAPQVAASPMPADAPVNDEAEALRAQIAALQAQIAGLDAAQSAPAGSEVGTPGRLPGTEEAARIAAEMAALKPPKS